MIIGAVGIIIAAIGLWFLGRKREWKRCPPVGLSCQDAITYLKPGKSQQKEREQLWKKKLMSGLWVLLGGSALLLIQGIVRSSASDYAPIVQIERPEPGEGGKKIELSAWILEEEFPLSIEVKERVPQAEEAQEAIHRSYLLLSEKILGENQSLDEVRTPLKLINYIEETACNVFWHIDNTERIDRNGHVHTEGLMEKEMIQLVAEISLGAYKKEYIFCVTVMPEVLSEEERLVREIKKRVQSSEEADGGEKSFFLPEEIGGAAVEYRVPQKNQSYILCVLVGIMAVLCTFLPDQKLIQQKKEKEEELALAYPEIVSKLCLLIGSGLTVRGAWERIIRDYREDQSFNYAYEEMLLTYYELERGMPEGKAYAAFGKRCRLSGYRKLGSLLEQNLKKGTAGLLALLQEETWQAFEERRAFAVKLAQEAGTRLLMPMLMLLLVVLVVCIAPAIMSF